MMCGTNNIQDNSLEDIVDGIAEVALSLRRKYHPIAIYVCGLLPHDNNCSINRIYIEKMNNYLCCKSKLDGINFTYHTDWTLPDGSLILLKTEMLNYLYRYTTPSNSNASKFNEIVSISSKLFACNAGFNLKQEGFPMLSCNVSVRNSVCNPDKSTVKYVRKSIHKSVSTYSVLPGKPIRDSNVCSSKLVSATSVRQSKLVNGSNVRSIKPVSVSSVCPSKQTCCSNIRPSKNFSAINVHASKPVYDSSSLFKKTC